MQAVSVTRVVRAISTGILLYCAPVLIAQVIVGVPMANAASYCGGCSEGGCACVGHSGVAIGEECLEVGSCDSCCFMLGAQCDAGPQTWNNHYESDRECLES